MRRETGRKKRMKEPYIEGIAIHDDPESCVGVREDEVEALTGAVAGWVLSREISQSRKPRKLSNPKAKRLGRVNASGQAILRGRRPQACDKSICTGTGRSLRHLVEMVDQDASRRPTAGRR